MNEESKKNWDTEEQKATTPSPSKDGGEKHSNEKIWERSGEGKSFETNPEDFPGK